MNVARPFKSAEIDKSEVDVEGKIRELVRRDSVVHRESERDSAEAASDLGSLMGRVSGSSTRQIDTLIDELTELREKLQTDGNRVQRDIVEYAALTQSVMQLTKIISDGVTHVKSPDIADGRGLEHASAIGIVPRDI
jgi:hypothetical protein